MQGNHRQALPVRAQVALLGAAALLVAAVLALAPDDGEPTPAGLGDPPVTAPEIVLPTGLPDEVVPSASPTPTGPSRTSRQGDRRRPGSHAPPDDAGGGPSRPGSSAVPLSPGTRVGLEPVTMAGHRVRHRDFVGRVDPVGPGSSALDRADSTFTVRRGLARPGCVSMESVNYPGHFLRHQNFRLFLHRVDGSALFAADATFCPVTGLTGQHTSLRSYNYPDRYVRVRDHDLDLAPFDGRASTRAAMTFAVRPAW